MTLSYKTSMRRSMMSRGRKIRLVYSALMAVTMIMSACATNGNQDGGGGADSGGDPACVSQASETVDGAKQLIEFVAPDEGFDMASNEGKTIWTFPTSMQNEFMASIAKGVDKAGTSAGLNVEIWDGKDDVSVQNRGVSQAVAQGADGIILQSISPTVVSGPLEEAFDAGIPVIDLFNSNPDDPLNGLFSHVTADFTKVGGVLASYVLADTECTANTLVLGTATSFELLTHQLNGIRDTYESLCPDCKFAYHDLNSATLATDGPRTVQNLLRRDPEVDWVIAQFDFLAGLLVPAIQEIGMGDEVKVIGHDGLPANLEYVRQGDVQNVDVAFPPTEYLGYLLFDEIGRAMAGEDSGNVVVPSQLFDGENIAPTDDALFPEFGDYQSAFEELWGLSQ